MDATELADFSKRIRLCIADDRFRVVLCLSFAIMATVSWPLWIETERFPRIPFVSGLPTFGPLGSRILFLGLILTTLFGIVNRVSLVLSAAILGWLISGDQTRFQPWAYYYGLTALSLATLSRRKAWGLARIFVIALYFHSGLSKLDVSFCRETGPWIIGALFSRLGFASEKFGIGWYYLILPGVEMAIAMGLCLKKTRAIALAAALAMHAALIVFLGPLGRRQSGDLLIWNVSMMIENLTLFRSKVGDVVFIRDPERAWEFWVRLIFIFAAILPFGERFGRFDAWPSFALYAGHVERTEIFITEEAARYLTVEARHALVRVDGQPWLRLDLSGWSRKVSGVPSYPANRTSNGLAQAIAMRIEKFPSVRVIEWGRADPIWGTRERREALGLDQIRRLGERYRLNARPEGSFSTHVQ